MLLYIFYGFILGVLTAPILVEIVMLYLVERFGRSRYSFKPDKVRMTPRQKDIFKQSVHATKDVAWFNIWMQRHWYELAHSYAHKDRLTRIILKKLNVLKRRRIAKDVVVEDVEISVEAPIIESVTVLTPSQYNDIMNDCSTKMGKNATEQKEDMLSCELNINNGFFDCAEKRSYTGKTANTEKISTCENGYHRIDEEDDGMNVCRRPFFGKNEDQFSPLQNCSANRSACAGVLKQATSKKIFSDSDFNFSQVFLLVDLKYQQYSTFHIKIFFLGDYKLETLCSLGNFGGKALVRMPANNQKNKWELSFLENPHFDVRIDAFVGHANSMKQYLNRVFSLFVKRMLYHSLCRQMIFPNFHSLLIPMVSSNLKYVDHKINEFDELRYEEWSRNLANRLFLYVSMNYKITRKNDTVTVRRSNAYINGESDRINLLEIDFRNDSAEKHPKNEHETDQSNVQEKIAGKHTTDDFPISRHENTLEKLKKSDYKPVKELTDDKTHGLSRIEEKDARNGFGSVVNETVFTHNVTKQINNIGEIDNISKGSQKIVDEMRLITDMESPDLNILSYFYNLSIFKYILHDFLYLKVSRKFNERISLVRLYFKKSVFDYVRIVRNNVILFQRNSTHEPEFFLIRMEGAKLQIFYYLINPVFLFSFKKGHRIRECILNRKVDGEEPDIKVTDMESRDTRNDIRKFKRMIELKEGLVTKVVSFDISSKNLRDILDDPVIRFRLMGMVVKIMDVQQISENTSLYFVKSRDKPDEMVKIMSFCDDSRIIDAETYSKDLICFYTVKQLNRESQLEVSFSQSLETYLRRFFISPVMIKAKFYRPDFKPLLLNFAYDKSIEYKFRCDTGSIMFEMYSEIADDFYITIKIDKEVLFSNLKIITTRKNRLVITISRISEVKIHIRPKTAKHRKFYLTIAQMKKKVEKGQNESMMDIVTSLGTNKSIEPKIAVGKGNIIFWDLEYDEDLIKMVSSKNYKSMISGFGILIGEDDVYKVTMKNEGLKNRSIRLCVGSTTNRL